MGKHELENAALLSRVFAGAPRRAVALARLKHALLSAAGGAALLICDASAAWAACTPSATNNVTAVCSGTTSTVYGTGVETNGVITINSGATLSLVNSDLRAINFGSITNLSNSGAISATTSSSGTVYGVSTVTSLVVGSNTGTIRGIGTGTGAAYGANANT